jgi:hypothetical protein
MQFRSAGACLAVLVIGLLAGGCDWYGFGEWSTHTGDNFGESTITPANVNTLVSHFSASDGTIGTVTLQGVVNGVLYASNASGLEAYSATGSTGCSGSPTTCVPLWSYATGSVTGSTEVGSGVVYSSTASGLEAFDATGQTNCSGTPKVCQPLWAVTGTFGTPTLKNGTVYVTTAGTLDAFDASGTTNCSGTPKVCSPLWTAPSFNTTGAVTVSGGIAYALSPSVGTQGGIVAVDAAGVRGCAGSPKVCSPLWEYATNYPAITYNNFVGGYPVISGTTLYVDTFYAPVPMQIKFDTEAFDATGMKNCTGTPTVCTPINSNFHASELAEPLVGDGAVFVSNPASIGITALDPTLGSLLWNTTSGTALTAEAIGGSVLYASDGTDVYAFDAGGSAGCSGSPVTCASLWSAPGTNAIVANGTLYVSATDTSGDGETVAYGLP